MSTSQLQDMADELTAGIDRTKETAIMAGHQILDGAGGLVDMGKFPEVSIEIANRIEEMIGSERIKKFTLIDDKRHGPKGVDYFWNGQLQKNTLAIDADPSRLMESYARGTNKNISSLKGLWSERALENEYNRRLKKEPSLRSLINKTIREVDEDNFVKTSRPRVNGCDINGCAKELLEVYRELVKRNISQVIMLVPRSCYVGICDASEVAVRRPKEFLESDIISIHHAFLNTGYSRVAPSKYPAAKEDVYYLSSVEHFSTDSI